MDIRQGIVRRFQHSKLYNILWGIKVWQNHQSIIKLSESNQYIFLKPIPPSSGFGGHVEHYYHFIFDLLLPLSFLIRNTPAKVTFVLNEFGVLTSLLVGLFGNRVKLQSALDQNIKKKEVELMGMNPTLIPIQHFPYKTLKTKICSNLKIKSLKKPNKILLIERLPPDPYYLNEATNRGSGTTRRSITNHECLKSFMETKVNPNYEFHNLQLEKMSLEDQIRYFDSACVVIAQHGAGLANILWMRKKSIVIELGYQSKIYFQNLSSILKHNYILFDYDEKHIEVDCTALHSKLLANDLTRPYFRE